MSNYSPQRTQRVQRRSRVMKEEDSLPWCDMFHEVYALRGGLDQGLSKKIIGAAIASGS
ncbi:MAG: hypothetical protein ACUZ8I_13725 [Candidatus Scalindua sp.]